MSLDWGKITPEGSNGNEILYVYNHDLSSMEKVDRTVRYITGRLNYYEMHLPENARHVIEIDIRGQKISESTLAFLADKIKERYVRHQALTIDYIK
jgi:hypothetical protein